MKTTFDGRLRSKVKDTFPSVDLPCQKLAFVYQRLSTVEQKKNHPYSLERQNELVRFARDDGYPEHLIYVERRDLGISGTLGQESREGLAYLIKLIEQDQVESVYVIEISRISRDQTLINGFQFGQLCKEHNVIIVTPSIRLNLRDELHERMYRYEIDRAAEEIKALRFRLEGAKEMKARHGYHVVGSLPPGYILDTDERLFDGSLNPNHLKYKPYQPHAEVIRILFQELAKPGKTIKSVALWSQKHGIVFESFPDDLRQVKANVVSFARSHRNPDGSYPVSVSRLGSIVHNPAYIGWYIWAGEVISKNNHPPIVDEETFWAVQNKFSRKGFAQQENTEPLMLSDLLYCADHQPMRRLGISRTRSATKGCYLCRHDDEEHICLYLQADVLDEPIGQLIVSQCSFASHAEEIISRLAAEHEIAKSKLAAYRREYQRTIVEIDHLKEELSQTRSPEQVDKMLSMIEDKMKEKAGLASVESQPITRILSRAEVETVRLFLANLAHGWDQMTNGHKNALLRLLLERVIIFRDQELIHAIVIWKTGLAQEVQIRQTLLERHDPWTEQEDSILKTNYSSLSRDFLCRQLPGRSWAAIQRRASSLGLRRSQKGENRHSNTKSKFAAYEDEFIHCHYRGLINEQQLLELLSDYSPSAVRQRARQLGLSWKERILDWQVLPVSPEVLAKIRRLWAAGESLIVEKMPPIDSVGITRLSGFLTTTDTQSTSSETV